MNHEIPDSDDKEWSGSGRRVDLTTTLYGKLRKMAAARMAAQPDLQSLQATALVHEAWLRLGGENQPQWETREQFFAAVAKAMRHILIDRARHRKRIRHGGGLLRVNMEAWNWEQLDASEIAEKDDTLLLVDELIEYLTENNPEVARLVQLHYFAGLTIAETARIMNMSERTAKRRLAYARAWLDRELRRNFAA